MSLAESLNPCKNCKANDRRFIYIISYYSVELERTFQYEVYCKECGSRVKRPDYDVAVSNWNLFNPSEPTMKPCFSCSSENLAVQELYGQLIRVKCFACSVVGPGHLVKNVAIKEWNKLWALTQIAGLPCFNCYKDKAYFYENAGGYYLYCLNCGEMSVAFDNPKDTLEFFGTFGNDQAKSKTVYCYCSNCETHSWFEGYPNQATVECVNCRYRMKVFDVEAWVNNSTNGTELD